MFCGNCGTKLKDGKCPKCDKKETKKTVKTEKVKTEKVKEEPVKEEKANFGWGVLGFFIPVVGLVLFLVFMNKKKSLAKTAGIGALIGVIKNVIVIILYYLIMFVGIFSIVNIVGNPQSPIYDPEPWNDLWDDEDDDEYEGYIETINVSDIDITEELSEKDFSIIFSTSLNSFR